MSPVHVSDLQSFPPAQIAAFAYGPRHAEASWQPLGSAMCAVKHSSSATISASHCGAVLKRPKQSCVHVLFTSHPCIARASHVALQTASFDAPPALDDDDASALDAIAID